VPNLAGTFSGTLNFPLGTDNVTATLTEGSGYSLTVQTTLSGADNGNFTFSGSAVANVMFVSGTVDGKAFSLFGYFDSSGKFTGTPNSIVVFDYNTLAYYGMLVKSAAGPPQQAPAITSASSATFAEGKLGSFTVTATGIPTPSIIESGALPTGVTFNAGTLGGTPIVSGTFPITFMAQNGITPNATQNFTLIVTPAPPSLTITTTSLPNGQVGALYSTTSLTATGGMPSYTWDLTGLPAGLTGSSSGQISGTPTVAGVYTVTAKVTDSSSPQQTATQNFSVTIASASGSTLFAPALTFGTGGYSTDFEVVVADLNGDGKPDLVVTNQCVSSSNCNNGTVGVLLGNGDGTFQPAVTYSSGGWSTSSIAVADVNGDGMPDIVVTNICVSSSNCNNGTVGVLLGNGGGTFQPAVSYGTGGYDLTSIPVVSVAVADLNGDGKPDIVVTNNCVTIGNCNDGAVGVLLGNGDGTFQTAVTYDSGVGESDPVSVVVADVNGDGRPDLVVANYAINASDWSLGGGVDVLLGNGDGTFRTAVTYGTGGNSTQSVIVADVNGDGKLDLAVANGGGYGYLGNASGVGVLLGNGDGTFRPAVGYASGGYVSWSVAVGDVNGDGKPDLVVTSCNVSNTSCGLSDGVVGVLLGNGDGTFQTAVTYDTGGFSPSWVAVADVNKDGKPDLVVANSCYNNSGCTKPTVGVLINTTTATTVDQSYTTFSGTGGTGSLSAAINEAVAFVAQTFTAGVTGYLTGVNIDVVSATTSGSPPVSPFPLNVAILAVSNGVPTSTVLAATTVPPGNVPLSVLVSFSQMIPITSGTQYAIAVNYIGAPPPGPGQGQGFWVGTTGNGYPRGAAFVSSDGNSWAAMDTSIGADLFFQTYVNPASAP
jgi:hypothetical protein